MKLFATLALAAFAASSFALTFSGSGFTLVDGTASTVGVASGVIPVTATGTVGSIDSVTLTNFTHTWLGDLEIRLTNTTTGTFVVLTSPPDGRSANFNGTYTFAVGSALQTIDEASLSQTSAYNLPSGSYAMSSYGGGTAVGPRTNFSAFTGSALAGNYQLTISDFASGDTGALGSWSFNVTPQAVPEPASMAVMSLAAVAVVRRRRRA